MRVGGQCTRGHRDEARHLEQQRRRFGQQRGAGIDPPPEEVDAEENGASDQSDAEAQVRPVLLRIAKLVGAGGVGGSSDSESHERTGRRKERHVQQAERLRLKHEHEAVHKRE